MKDYNKLQRKQAFTIFKAIEKKIAPGEMKRIKAAYELSKKANEEQYLKSGEQDIAHPAAVSRIIKKELGLDKKSTLSILLNSVVKDIYDKLLEEQITSIYKSIEKRMVPEDMERVKNAFEFAKKAHEEVKKLRKSGEPYIFHPVAVASIVAKELQLGPNSIIAAFLHDVVEDTKYKVKDIKTLFGDDVAFLVRVLTKKKKQNVKLTKQLDNFKQILNSVKFDVRAILIKLADRLHNMRTLSSMDTRKQMKIAGETDYFFAPLANRLGLYEVMTELLNLSFRFRCSKEYAALEKLMEEEKDESRAALNSFKDKISLLLLEKNISAKLEIKHRTPYSQWRRMKKHNTDFKHLNNKSIVWIIFPNDTTVSEKDMCLYIYSYLTDVFKEKQSSIVNYIDTPKENGYQSFHLKLFNEFRGGWEEVHISSERMVQNSELGCVAERTDKNIDNWINKFKKVLKNVANNSIKKEFIDGIASQFYYDDIVVFTPEGDGVILPQRATALDFAYDIHEDLGKYAQYARINGKLSSVLTVLRRGDCVEIITNEKISAKSDWLNSVMTFKARKNLKLQIKKIKTIPFKRCSLCSPLPGDELVGYKSGNNQVTIHKRSCSEAITLAFYDGDSIVDVNFEEDPDILYPASISIKAIDRNNLLRDLTACISEKLDLSITKLYITTKDEIVDCIIDFSIHSAVELQEIISSINSISGVDEVRREELT